MISFFRLSRDARKKVAVHTPDTVADPETSERGAKKHEI